MKGRQRTIQTMKPRCFILVRRPSVAIAIKVLGSNIQRVNFAMPFVVFRAPSMDLLARAQPLQKYVKIEWYVDVVAPYEDDCPHCTDFKVRGAWLQAGVRETIETTYFDKPLRKLMSNHPTEKICWHLQGAHRKNYCGVMNMTLREFTTMLKA